MSDSGLRALFIAPVDPWARESGSSVIIADLLHGLASTSNVTVLPLFLRRSQAQHTGSVPRGLAPIQLESEMLPKWLSVAKAIARGSTPLRYRLDNQAVALTVERSVRQAGFVPDVVHVEHLPMIYIGAILARRFGAPLVYRSHNHESQLLERRFPLKGRLARPIISRLEAAEAAAIGICDLTLCISEHDLAWIHRNVPGAAAHYFPCSLLTERYREFIDVPRSLSPQIGFAGGLDWAPNENGLRWFMERVLPAVRRAVPGVRLHILARGSASRSWLTSDPAVTLLDDATDARHLFASSWLTIAPLLQGSGVRIKIPESLLLGCPVVSTSIGAEGHDLIGLDRADDPESFARACIGFLDPARATNERAASYRAGVEERYGAHELARQLASLWANTVAARLSARSNA